jgi:hypothetical protein
MLEHTAQRLLFVASALLVDQETLDFSSFGGIRRALVVLEHQQHVRVRLRNFLRHGHGVGRLQPRFGEPVHDARELSIADARAQVVGVMYRGGHE